MSTADIRTRNRIRNTFFLFIITSYDSAFESPDGFKVSWDFPRRKFSAIIFSGVILMLKKIVMISIPLLLLVVVFVPIENRILYWSLFVVLFLLAYLFHIMEDVVRLKDVQKKLGMEDFFNEKAGIIVIQDNKAELLKGMIVIFNGQVLFYRRAGGTGGAVLTNSFPVDTIEGYEIGKVDDFHPGITFTLNGGEEVKFTSKKLAQREADIRKALGWETT